jgi:transposase
MARVDGRQAPPGPVRGPFALQTQRLGPLFVVNHFLARLGLAELLARHCPSHPRASLPPAAALGVLLRSIVVEREPIYRQGELVEGFCPEAFGLDASAVQRLRDDQVGRALDRLFDADRGTLLTQVVVAAAQRFDLKLDELHNDSTTVRLCGQYHAATGRSLRGKRAPWITYGYSKDHRPDLKQLLFVLTTSQDGAVPVQFRCADGNTSDSQTHIETWKALCQAAGRVDFLYVADSKLCSSEVMHEIDRVGGRFVTVLPRSRKEDKDFRRWIQTHTPAWEQVIDRPHPRRRYGPRDRWYVFRYPLLSRESWPIIWVWSTLLALDQERRRLERIAKANEELEEEDQRLRRPRPKRRSREQIQERVDEILLTRNVWRYLKVELWQEELETFRQERPGRPGPRTRYTRRVKRRWRLRWSTEEDVVEFDHKSDGMYPLISNDRALSPRQVLEAHKRQPTIEKRFEQGKSVHELAPVFLKNEGRIEALFFLYFLALLVQALIERELRQAMATEGIEELPLYPEERTTKRPTAAQILRLYSLTTRHVLTQERRTVQIFEPQFTPLQAQVLRLLGVPPPTLGQAS